MSKASPKVMVIFWDALDCATPAEQAAYLERACGGDTAVRANPQLGLDLEVVLVRCFCQPSLVALVERRLL